ncbi:MAG: CotH kinase family protein [Polyangiaceae bacterium]
MATVAGCGGGDSGTGGNGGGATTTTSASTGGAGGTGGAPVTSAYDPNHVIEVAVTMDPTDWEKLRSEANDLDAVLGGDCLAGPKQSVYSYYPASVTVDGQAFSKVDVRKKGFIGSLSYGRPSLKVKLDAYDSAASYLGTNKLTLNNMKQDGARIRTCLALEMFQEAGVPASRCSFAHVTVNGEDLGIYDNIEGIDGAELADRFPDGSGNLYEGVMSDFRPDWEDTYQKKTNTADPDRSDLSALTTALQASDADLLAQVQPLLDVDAFLSFWATESIIELWDGYSNGQNNHLVYHEPTSGKFYFLPWGPDATFGSGGGTPPPGAPISVYGLAELPRRLYGLPAVREQYLARLLQLNDKLFQSGLALSEVDRMDKLLAPYAKDSTWEDEVAQIRQWVTDRPAAVQAEVAAGPVDYAFPQGPYPCVAKIGTVTGSFTTKMGTLAKNNPIGTGTGTLHLDVNGMAVDAQTVGAAAGLSSAQPTLLVMGILPGGKIQILVFLIDPVRFESGDLPFDLQMAFGVYGQPGPNDDFQQLGLLDKGTLHLEKAGSNDKDEVVGTFTTDIYSIAL